MATFGDNNISLNAVRAVLGESSKSLWNLCNNPNINKWAKYSPQTDNGKAIPFATYTVSNPFDVAQWEYNKRTITQAKLGDFRRYKHDAQNPIVIGWPEQLYYNAPNSISMGETGDLNNIKLSDLGISNKYMGVAVRRVSSSSDKRGNWCTGNTTGDWTVPLDFKGIFSSRIQVELVVFLTDIKKTSLTEPDKFGDFWSVKTDANVIDRKTYTLSEFVPPTTYELIYANESPTYGNWYYDVLTFDNIDVVVKSKIDYHYKFKVVVEFPESGDWQEVRMQSEVKVLAGQQKTVFSTGRISVNNFRRENMAWIKVLDMNNSNRVVYSSPVHNMNM
ncbi:MAG: hypothetical protein ACRCX4_06980 [Bacteroidales bacterium]